MRRVCCYHNREVLPVKSRYFVAALALAAGVFIVIVGSFGLRSTGGLAAPPPGKAAATPTVSPSPTSTIPTASHLLAASYAKTAGKNSVFEAGTVSSTKNNVYDGRQLQAAFSWKSHTLKESWHFKIPTTVSKQIKNVKKLQNVVIGAWVAAHGNHQWFCKKTTLKANGMYWAVPSFALQHPATVGQSKVDGHTDWIVRGNFQAKSGNAQSKLVVQLYIDQRSFILHQVQESGSVKVAGVGKARIQGTLKYSGYGHQVTAKLPHICFKH